MAELASQAGRKALAVTILAVAALLLFKFVLGVVSAVAWFAVVVVALVAVVWAVRAL